MVALFDVSGTDGALQRNVAAAVTGLFGIGWLSCDMRLLVARFVQARRCSPTLRTGIAPAESVHALLSNHIGGKMMGRMPHALR